MHLGTSMGSEDFLRQNRLDAVQESEHRLFWRETKLGLHMAKHMEHFGVDFPFKELIDGRMFPESFGTLYRSASFLEFQHFHTPNSEWTDLTQQLEIFQSLLLLWQVSDWSEAFENPMIFT